MHYWTSAENKYIRVWRMLLPVVAGALIAGISAALLSALKPVWTALFLIGGIAVILSFLVKDTSAYWLGLLLLSLPMNIHKDFRTEQSYDALRAATGLPWGANSFFVELPDLLFLPLLLLWLLRKFHRREPLHWPAINAIPLLFLGWVAIGTLFSSFPVLSILELIRQVKYILFYLWAVDTVDMKNHGKMIVLMVLVGVVIQSGVTMYKQREQQVSPLLGDVLGKADPLLTEETIELERGGQKRAFGTFGHPNQTSMHYEICLPVAFSIFLISPSLTARLSGLAVFAVGLGGLSMTYSRGAMAGFLLGITLCFAVSWFRRLIPLPVLMGILFSITLASPVLILKLPAYFQTRPEYFSERVAHWHTGLQLAQRNPILGTGLNTSTAQRVTNPPKGLQPTDDDLPVHNHYLAGLAEIGFIGLLLYVGFFAIIGIRAFLVSGSPDRQTATIAIGILGSLASLAVHMTVDFLNMDALHRLLWLYASMIVCIGKCDLVQGVPETTAERRSG